MYPSLVMMRVNPDGGGKGVMTPLLFALLLLFNVSQIALAGDYEDGVDALARGDYTTAAQKFRQAAEAAHTEAQFSLGAMYFNGEGVLQDDKEAARWYAKSAEAGFAFAQVQLAWMYANGLGVPKDDHEAVRWYRQAAEAGHAKAQNQLGWMYEKGRGVPQDDHEAARWYRQAAEAGFAFAKVNLSLMYTSGRGVPEDYVQALRWADLAAATAPNKELRDLAVKIRSDIAGMMSQEQIAEAQRLTSE